jgi:ZIP family zinc transporter
MEGDIPFALLLTSLAGLSTGIGSVVALFMRPKDSHLAAMLSFAAGIMLYISFAVLLKTAIEDAGPPTAALAFFIGIAFIAVVDLLIPHGYEEKVENTSLSRGESRQASVLMRAGVLTALGIAIHNFPEGLVTFSSAVTGDVAFGITVAVAIALHNIPEGMAISVPIFYATGSRRKAFIYSFSSGLAEPAGALIGYAILMPFLSPVVMSSLLAFAAGVMVFISLAELLPLARRYGKGRLVIAGAGAGILLTAGSLFLLS